MEAKQKRHARIKRHSRVRLKVSGTPSRPRLAVYRSNRHIYAQIVDDVAGNTLVSAYSREVSVEDGKGKTGVAEAVGRLLAERARDRGIGQVVFDRGGFLFHGRVRSLAQGARDTGLEF
ncbi:MAG: 50S ribosomal protein L18 [Actinomycetota bacterium]